MSQASTITEALDWLGGIADEAFLTLSYPEVVRDVARLSGAFYVAVALNGLASVSTYTVPVETIRIAHVLWFPFFELERVDTIWLDTIALDWPIAQETPQVWVEDQHSQNTFRVAPIPLENAPIVAMVQTVPSATGIPEWLEGLIAMRMAARETIRLGELQDAPLAQALMTIADGLMVLLLATDEG